MSLMNEGTIAWAGQHTLSAVESSSPGRWFRIATPIGTSAAMIAPGNTFFWNASRGRTGSTGDVPAAGRRIRAVAIIDVRPDPNRVGQPVSITVVSRFNSSIQILTSPGSLSSGPSAGHRSRHE